MFWKKFLNLAWSDIFPQSDSGYKSLYEEYHRSDTVFSILIGLRGMGNFDQFIKWYLLGPSTKKLHFLPLQLINIEGKGNTVKLCKYLILNQAFNTIMYVCQLKKKGGVGGNVKKANYAMPALSGFPPFLSESQEVEVGERFLQLISHLLQSMNLK